MSDQSEALRLADSLSDIRRWHDLTDDECDLAAAELRRQHSRIEELESELMEQCRINGMGAERELAKIARIEADEALMRAAADTLSYYASVCGEDDQPTPAKAAITALRKRLESSNAS